MPSMHFEMAGPITFYLIVQIDPWGRFQVGIGYCSEYLVDSTTYYFRLHNKYDFSQLSFNNKSLLQTFP